MKWAVTGSTINKVEKKNCISFFSFAEASVHRWGFN
jgi:hypothetical protein